jgi:UDP-2-acetamido-3-amino-2,3-dideoxy-glucuronate N-acetyltransferase
VELNSEEQTTGQAPFVHVTSEIQSAGIEAGTEMWQYGTVPSGALIGYNCNVCSHGFIKNDVTVGSNVTVESGVPLWEMMQIEDDISVGPIVKWANDRFPPSRYQQTEFMTTAIRQGVSIDGNATILRGLTIGPHAMVGACPDPASKLACGVLASRQYPEAQ